MKKSMKTPKKIWKITTSCTLITEYTDENFKNAKDVYESFEYEDGKEIDYQNEGIDTVEFSINGGKTWKQA